MLSLVFDTETTGPVAKADHTDKGNSKIVQIYAALFEHDIDKSYIEQIDGKMVCTAKPVQQVSLVLDAGVDIPKGAFDVHGISREKTEAMGVDPKRAIDLLGDLFSVADAHVAHNKQFDTRMVAHAAHAAGLDPNFLDGKFNVCTMKILTPVMKLMPKRFGDYRYPKLIAAHEYLYGYGFDGAHDAAEDSLAAARIYFALLHMQGAEILSQGKKS